MKPLILGTAGHVDHGKTALVRALTGVDTDRWEEEKRRGLTIDLGFARLDLEPDLQIAVIDVPGHEDFVKNMLTGSTGMDLVLLVVAADEGPMPQTREHLAIAGSLGVTAGVVALNKVDRVDGEWLEMVREATREELAEVPGSASWPIVPVSAVSGAGLDELRAAIRAVALEAPARCEDDAFRMPVDRSFSVAGAGTVATGTVWSGTVRTGDTVRVLPGDLHARVRSLQVHGEDTRQVGAGRRCALALVGADTESVGRGTVVVREEGWRPEHRFGVRVAVHAGSPRELEHGQRVRVFLGTAEVMARILISDRAAVRRGEAKWAVLECEHPLVGRVGDRFILRFYSPVCTVAGGRVAELGPPRSWRRRIRCWESLLSGAEDEVVAAAIRCAGGRGVDAADLPLVTGVSRDRAVRAAMRSSSVVSIGDRWVHESSLDEMAELVLRHLRAAHAARPRASGEPLESVRAALAGRYNDAGTDEVILRLARAGAVTVSGPSIRLSDHRPALSAREQQALEQIRRVLDGSGLEPPAPAELSRGVDVGDDAFRDLLRLLTERGEVVPVTPDLYVTAEHELRAREAVRGLLEAADTPLPPGAFRTVLASTRKYLIPLLEHMDRLGVTRRTPEGRVRGDG